ncbi:AMP-binding enzyme [Hirsutella rhossiliensis]|uniref:AMP-binding enzyme domain-containing protein n=1 Tax=Hirsutella rhossiliensis TaxID=111463 RepID=A0A9P8MNG7_9HYPO|nr:AMP-binding enzyme domain-containing protein [Hirsutella rhossiliensis]KAH0958305.1 AMP-binding enzyme domain-containing protein [Hirsutella rhossiliensis]
MKSHSEQTANGPREPIEMPQSENENHLRYTDNVSVSSVVVPEPIEACVHSLFKRVAIERSSSPAICSWDGALTYGQLDLLSSRLACHLIGLGVKPGTMVILCFEKSLLAPVAVLGVAKAGGASISLDSSQSHDHLRAIIAQVPHPILLSSPGNSHLARQLVACDVMVLDDKLLSAPEMNPSSPFPDMPVVSPSDTLNVIFMPGDTGSHQPPGGVAITHRNMSTALFYQQQALGYTIDSRVFDIAPQGSYLAWCNLLHTLTCGGCLCIPSEYDRRQRVEGSMTALQANAVHLTPAMAEELNHHKLAGRVRLTYVGEPQMTPPDTTGHQEGKVLFSSRGYAESTSLGTRWTVNKSKVRGGLSHLDDGVCAWVAETAELGSLGACETMGELWLEGPMLGQKYPVESDSDAPVIFKDSVSVLRRSTRWPGRPGRIHRTGDLVRHMHDGRLVLVEEEEPADVDHSGESVENLHSSSESDGALETPETEQGGYSDTVQLMLMLWAQVFQLSPQSIGKDDDFFQLGGDATKALCLCRIARDRGLNFSARDVYQNPCLCDLSVLASPASRTSLKTPPFSLLGSFADDDDLRAQVAQLCRVQKSQVVDLFPCSPLQEGMLALTQRRPGSYVAQQVFEIDDGVSVQRLRRAWDQVVAMNPILRTHIVSLPSHGLVQAVLEQGAQWGLGTDLDDYQARQSAVEQPMGLGTPLSKFAIIDAGPGRRPYFLWEIHHALFDGWSLPLLMSEAEHAYYNEGGQDLESMEGFIKYIKDCDETAAKAFWRAQFAGIQETHFPLAKAAALRQPQSASHVNFTVSGLGWGHSDYTQASMVRAAWAVVMARCGNTSEALYGVTVTGRQAAVPGIEHMAGPAIATVPVRVTLDWEASVSRLLEAVQRQAADMIPFEQTGLQRIRRMGEAAAIACSFQSLLVVQPADGEGDPAGRAFLSKPSDDGQAKRESGHTTYAIEVECELGSDEARLRIDFDPGVVQEREMEAIAQNFDHVLRQLADQGRRHDKLGTLALSTRTPSNRIEEVLAWNAKVPERVDECVHKLIEQRARESPLAPALCAWDGELTYQDLDEQSTKLAYRLAARGVAGTRVPVLFEKSLWMPVTVLAVMKAGGALVALETKEPEERLLAIVSKTTSPVLLSSVQNGNLARRLVADGKEVLVVGASPQHESLAPDPDHLSTVLPTVDPSSLLYVVFTSGSTGTPKGVLITHRNFCSAIAHQRQALDYNRNARVLDFASCAFDVAWSNLFLTLTAGACFCIPSPVERENDLAGCLVKYNVTLADLTPSVARAIGSDALSRLTTMILGGEAPLPSDASLAGGKTHIINAYGPAECTPTSTLTTLDPTNVCIGRGLGLCTWVVEPDNPELLVPVGDVGELWLEGPLVGQGYLDDPQRTAAAFIDDPVWLMQAVGRRGRVYRTGDLVRYRDDGSLVFIGRKDTQVKIRGQRVELAEVECCVRQVIGESDTVQVVAEAVQPAGANNPILVAFVTLPGAEAMTQEAHGAAVRQATDGLTERLREVLPSYMVPAAYLPIQEMPVTTAGKTDRRHLRALGASMWPQYRSSRDKKEGSSQPLNETETILQKVWMSVLNLSADEASVDAGFSSLGGDSISAMQLANTIRKLAARRRPMSTSASKLLEEAEQQENEDAAAEFDLSPMQQSFFNDYPDGLNHFNQSFLLDLGHDVSAESLSHAMMALVSRHAMLRARFTRDPGSGLWKQSVAQNVAESFAFAEHSVTHRDEVGTAGQWRQENLDICQGPVFACDLFNMPDGSQVVLLSAHHLVIDLVSWRIVWNDVEEYIKFGELRSPKTLSFRTWCAVQARVGNNLSPLAVLPYPIPEPDVGFWGLPMEENTFGQCDSFDVALPLDASKLLFGNSNNSLRTEALDLILGALSHSFFQTFPERSAPAIWIEGHGREQLDDVPTDVSGTVGWFTTMYPLAVSITPDQSISHAVRLVKDTRRRVPNMGLPFYACQHYSESGRQAFQGHDVYELIFNFTGRFQQLEREEGLFKSSQHGTDDADVKICEISKSARRFFMIEIGAVVSDNVLVVSFNFHKGMKHQGRIEKWTQAFIDDLECAARHLARAPVAFTLSDLPLLQLSYRGLDVLLEEQLPKMGIKPSSVTNMYPCSPLQEGMLLSSVKGSASYITYTIWRCVSTVGNTADISPSRLEEAWKRVVSRHTALSTVFALHPEGNGFMQLVLDEPPIRVNHIAPGLESPTDALSRLQEPTFAPDEPEHSLTICQAPTGEVACRLDMSHALTDAHSASLILSELATIYDGMELSSAPAFADMIRFINSTPRAQIVASWTSLLDGLEPCEFPLSPVAPAQAEREKFTEIPCPGTFKVAWAMVLSHMTGMRDVCFGYLASGRDAPVNGVENLVGPLANLLISRVDLRQPARQVLETTSERSKQHMAIQHVSLAEIQHHLGLSGRRLFNTSLSVRPAEKEKADEARGVSFDVLAGGDAHEFDIKFNASISGADMDLSIEFREPYVDRQVALEASKILHQAIEYLLVTDVGLGIKDMAEIAQDVFTDANDADTLLSGFFKHTMGVDEASASAFWKAEFANTQGSHFPSPTTTTRQPMPRDHVELSVEGLDWACDSFLADTTVKAAWAVLTARIMCADESIFGAAVSKCGCVAPLPLRVVVDSDHSINDLLLGVQRQTVEMAPFHQMGMERVRRLNEDAAMACNFQTLLVVYPKEDKEHWQSHGAHSMVVMVGLEATAAHIDVKFDPRVIEQARVSRLIHGFVHVLRQLLDVGQRQLRLRDVTVASQKDLDDVWTWNATLPESVEGCVHDLIIQHGKERPTAPAIHAWDGVLTYEQLEELSSKLAKQLVSKGVGPGSIVPLCFEKSCWMPVAALAVMRAGGASVAVDTSQPEERIRTITAQVFTGAGRPKILLSSEANHALAQRLEADEVLITGHEQCLGPVIEPSPELPVVKPSDVLYVVFTSGSTGRPKGVIITHQNFYSAISYQRDAVGVDSSSRVFDFSSYAFDVAWLSLLKALTAGGCLCIPSAAEREDDLGGCLERYGVTVVDLTPSVARAIEPKSALSNLSTLILGGEAVVASDADLAGEKTQVTVAYGPAECTPTSSIMDLTKTRDAGIGRGVGMCLWVVDLENPAALAPVGAVGELWLEGPLVGQGYLHEPEKTRSAFIQDPAWLVNGTPDGRRPGRRGRVYRTGDLVRYREDGSLLFVGRKDTQVKIRGQRVELGDIEHHVCRAIETIAGETVTNVQVVAETVQPKGIPSKMLVAFVALEEIQGFVSSEEYNNAVRHATAGVTEHLAKALPVFMIPSLYIPIPTVPMSATGKTDRRRLQEMGSSLSAKDVKALGRAGEQRRTPETEAERVMQALWADILNMDPESIGADDSFFRIGGDSIGAMRLVGMARYKGFSFTVRDVFQSPVLSDLSAFDAAPPTTLVPA